MKPGADVRSIDALRAFRAELKRYLASLNGNLETLKIQSNRASEWIETDRARYWPRQAKRAEDNLVEARNALLRCKMAAMEGQTKSCVDEKRAVERWIQRLRHCEAQVRALRGWRQKMRHQADDFSTRMARLANYAENDLPKAIAVLDRMILALDRYTQTSIDSAGSEPSAASAGDSATLPGQSDDPGEDSVSRDQGA